MNINKMVDHTLLKADAKKSDVIRYCEEAKEFGFASVVVNSVNMEIVAEELKGSDVNPVAVIGFPLGASLTSVKVFETFECVRLGAKEIDMVINIGALKDRDYEAVEKDIRAVVEAANPAVVKVILETCLLTNEEIIKGSLISVKAGALFVKTSTGFSTGGATVDHIKLIRCTIEGSGKVKASGGIRNAQQAKELIEAGADRLGVGDGKLVTENYSSQNNSQSGY